MTPPDPVHVACMEQTGLCFRCVELCACYQLAKTSHEAEVATEERLRNEQADFDPDP